MPKPPSVAFALLLALSPAARAVTFDAYTVEDGLPANTITDILQTRDGYLWLATPNGLARFDGVRFTVLDRGSGSGLDANRCVSLVEAPDGTLWVATDVGIVS